MGNIGKILIGGFVVLVVIGITAIVFGGIIMKKLTGNQVQQTPISQNINQGKITTSPQNGTQVGIGANKIPDGFPKDFPIYPGSTITSSSSGDVNGRTNSLWLTLNTKDDVNKVTTYYQDNLKANGWTVQTSTVSTGFGTDWTISKGTVTGYVTIAGSKNPNGTSVLLTLGTNSSPTPGNK